jgi:flagellin
MSVINTNFKSLITQNNLTVNNRALSQAMEELSTGKRINSASDDAAGLAISNKMTAQIRGLNQSVRNANDGISMIQTAEGALKEVTNMLQRMRELAVQSANDTNTSSDRFALDLEYQQLGREISRIATNTQWNAMNILNNTEVGQAGTAHDVGEGVRNVKFQVGANPNQVINLGLKDFSYNLGIGATQSESKFSLGNMSGMQDFQFKLDGQTINFSASRKIGYNDSGAALLDARGNPVTVMTEEELVDFTTQMKKAITDTEGFSNVSVTRVGQDIYVSDAEGRAIGGLAAADPVGVSAISEWEAADLNETVLGLNNMAGKKDFSLNVNGQAVNFSVANAIVGDVPTDAEAGAIATALESALDAAFGADEYTVAGDTTAGVSTLTITAPEVTFGFNNMYTDGNGNSIVDPEVAIDNGVTATSETVVTFDPAAIYNADNNTLISNSFRMNVGGQWMDLSINPALVENDSVNIASIQEAFEDGIQAALDTVYGKDNFAVANTGWEFTITSQIHFNTGDLTGSTGAATRDGAGNLRVTASVIAAGVEAVDGLTPNGNPNSVFSGSARLNDTSLKTQASSNVAVDRLDNAMANVDRELATFGAVINRLTYAADNLTTTSQNTSFSRSRILDTDYAAATTELARTQIIQQAGMAMLAQANQQPQTVLSLLQ